MPSTGLPWEITLAGTGGGSCLLMQPQGVTSRPVALLLQGEQVGVPSGAGFLDKDGGMPTQRFEFQYVIKTREQAAFLRDYFDTREGRFQPFWFPTWIHEVTVSDYVNGADLFGHLWLVSRGYAEKIWPLGAQYRRIFTTIGNQWVANRVLSVALNSPTPGIEELVLTDGSGPGVGGLSARPYTEARGFHVLSLRFGRFDTDAFLPQPAGDGNAVVTLPIIEIPDEAIEGA